MPLEPLAVTTPEPSMLRPVPILMPPSVELEAVLPIAIGRETEVFLH